MYTPADPFTSQMALREQERKVKQKAELQEAMRSHLASQANVNPRLQRLQKKEWEQEKLTTSISDPSRPVALASAMAGNRGETRPAPPPQMNNNSRRQDQLPPHPPPAHNQRNRVEETNRSRREPLRDYNDSYEDLSRDQDRRHGGRKQVRIGGIDDSRPAPPQPRRKQFEFYRPLDDPIDDDGFDGYNTRRRRWEAEEFGSDSRRRGPDYQDYGRGGRGEDMHRSRKPQNGGGGRENFYDEYDDPYARGSQRDSFSQPAHARADDGRGRGRLTPTRPQGSGGLERRYSSGILPEDTVDKSMQQLQKSSYAEELRQQMAEQEAKKKVEKQVRLAPAVPTLPPIVPGMGIMNQNSESGFADLMPRRAKRPPGGATSSGNPLLGYTGSPVPPQHQPMTAAPMNNNPYGQNYQMPMQQQNSYYQPSQGPPMTQFGGPSGYSGSTGMNFQNPDASVKTANQVAYLAELQNQVEYKKRIKEAEKQKIYMEDMKKEREMAEYNPWGKGGAGAPLKDGVGNVITNTKTIVNQKQLGLNPDVTTTPMTLLQQQQQLQQQFSMGGAQGNPYAPSPFPQSQMPTQQAPQPDFTASYGGNIFGNALNQLQQMNNPNNFSTSMTALVRSGSGMMGLGGGMGGASPVPNMPSSPDKSFLRGAVNLDEMPPWQREDFLQKQKKKMELENNLKQQMLEREAKKREEQRLQKEEERREAERIDKEQALIQQRYEEEQKRKQKAEEDAPKKVEESKPKTKAEDLANKQKLAEEAYLKAKAEAEELKKKNRRGRSANTEATDSERPTETSTWSQAPIRKPESPPIPTLRKGSGAPRQPSPPIPTVAKNQNDNSPFANEKPPKASYEIDWNGLDEFSVPTTESSRASQSTTRPSQQKKQPSRQQMDDAQTIDEEPKQFTPRPPAQRRPDPNTEDRLIIEDESEAPRSRKPSSKARNIRPPPQQPAQFTSYVPVIDPNMDASSPLAKINAEFVDSNVKMSQEETKSVLAQLTAIQKDLELEKMKVQSELRKPLIPQQQAQSQPPLQMQSQQPSNYTNYSSNNPEVQFTPPPMPINTLGPRPITGELNPGRGSITFLEPKETGPYISNPRLAPTTEIKGILAGGNGGSQSRMYGTSSSALQSYEGISENANFQERSEGSFLDQQRQILKRQEEELAKLRNVISRNTINDGEEDIIEDREMRPKSRARTSRLSLLSSRPSTAGITGNNSGFKAESQLVYMGDASKTGGGDVLTSGSEFQQVGDEGNSTMSISAIQKRNEMRLKSLEELQRSTGVSRENVRIADNGVEFFETGNMGATSYRSLGKGKSTSFAPGVDLMADVDAAANAAYLNDQPLVSESNQLDVGSGWGR